MNSRSDALSRLPRPNRVTFRIVAVAVALGAAGHFLLSKPGNAELDKTSAATTKVQAELERDRRLLGEYRKGQIVEGPALAGRVGTVEAMLPGTSVGSGRVFSDLQAVATARGLGVSDLQVDSEYAAAKGESANGYPDVLVAHGSMRLTGTTAQLLAFLAELDAYPQLVSYTSSGIAGAPQAPTMQLQMRLWSSTDPEWRNGIPNGGARPGS